MEPQYITLPKQAIDLTGRRFGRLVALGPISKSLSTQIIWRCVCDCGNSSDVISQSLRSGATISCGCWKSESFARAKTTHGLSKTRLYRVWKGMVTRCTNANVPGYKDYGGRGIKIFPNWLDDFQVFFDHVRLLDNCENVGYSLDRINNNGNYEPGNVRWATRTEQNRNSRHNRNFTYDGKTQTITEWASEFGLRFATLDGRLRRGWDMERALRTPTRKWR